MSHDTARFPFVVNQTYSLGLWLKDYGHYPKDFPLCTYMDHGMTLFDKIPDHEIENEAPLIFKFSPRLVEIYKTQCKKPVYNLVNPAIYYRSKFNIKKLDNAKGALFFVGHSTPDIDDHTDWDQFIQSLKNIPSIYYPIDICLHPADVKKGMDVYFRKKGFQVVSAGPANADEFISRFYNNLSRYQYVLSNMIGSYTFYAVEMGIPFSLFGSEPIYFNKSDENVEKGYFNSYREQPSYLKAKNLFAGFYETITKEQKEFVEFETGKNTTISRKQTRNLLYKAFVIYMAKHPSHLRFIKNAVSMQINERFKLGYRMARNWYNKVRSPKQQKKPELKMSNWERLNIRHLNSQGIKTTVLSGHKIKFMQPRWFLHNYDEIYKDHVYFFESNKKSPLIIDCGSNIGLSIIYFKLLFPESIIVGFEPDPSIFSLLRDNISSFNFPYIELNNAAIWNKNEILSFKVGYLEGHIEENANNDNCISVKALRLKDILEKYESIDFLKIDIEGAEFAVLEDCASSLSKVKNVFIEFHNKGGNYLKDLHQILSILEQNNFRYHMKQAYNFLDYPYSNDAKENFKEIYNSQNIFAFQVDDSISK